MSTISLIRKGWYNQHHGINVRKNTDDGQVLQLGIVQSLNQSNFNPVWPVKIYAGGWPAGDGANIKAPVIRLILFVFFLFFVLLKVGGFYHLIKMCHMQKDVVQFMGDTFPSSKIYSSKIRPYPTYF